MVRLDRMETFAEGIATRVPFALPLAILRAHLDEAVLVSDEDLRRAVLVLAETVRQTAEGAGAASTAAALRLRAQLRGKTVVQHHVGDVARDLRRPRPRRRRGGYAACCGVRDPVRGARGRVPGTSRGGRAMTHRERIDAAVRGERPDRVPAAVWRHFPGDDQRAEQMARVHIEHYRVYDLDLLKVTPASGYYGDDWGLRAGFKPNREGVRHYTDRPIKKAADWERLKRVDPSQGVYGREAHAIRLVAEAVGREVPVLETVFSPLSVARTLAGEQATVRYLREEPEALHRGLEVIADVTAAFVREVIAAGADGVFFSTQMATTDLLTEEEYEEFGRPYDLRVLDAASGALTFLHLHGQNVMFDLVASYPIQILNWHARETAPTIAEARARVSTCLACGIDAWNTLAKASPEEVAREVRAAVADTGGRGHIVTTGCVMPVDTPEANIRAAIAAAREA
jgi:uroporphyrinogen decarboxylase